MLTTELTSRKIWEGMKEAGYKCDLNVIFERPFEDAVVEVIADEKVWSATGVVFFEGNALAHADEEVKAEMRANLSLQFRTTLVFNNYDEMNEMITKFKEVLITHLEEPTNDDGSVPTTFYKEIPLIDGDEIEMSSVIQQFEAFKTTILGVLSLGKK